MPSFLSYVICLMLILNISIFSCRRNNYSIKENYAQLFPNNKIETANNNYENLDIHLCDPDLASEEEGSRRGEFKSPGLIITPARTYTVTLATTFICGNNKKKDVKYRVSYVDSCNKLRVIKASDFCTRSNCNSQTTEIQCTTESDCNAVKKCTTKCITKDKCIISKEVKFKVTSGTPIYLSVTGVGPRGSGVEASISAISDDSLIRVSPLKVKEFQNSEGPNRLNNPYCQYIILP